MSERREVGCVGGWVVTKKREEIDIGSEGEKGKRESPQVSECAAKRTAKRQRIRGRRGGGPGGGVQDATEGTFLASRERIGKGVWMNEGSKNDARQSGHFAGVIVGSGPPLTCLLVGRRANAEAQGRCKSEPANETGGCPRGRTPPPTKQLFPLDRRPVTIQGSARRSAPRSVQE